MADDDFAELTAYLASAAPELLRVVPVAMTLSGEDGGRLIITSAEIWTGMIVIHVATIGAPLPSAAPGRLSSLEDDRGNTYALLGASSGAGSDGARTLGSERWSYVGPVAEDASALIFRPARAAGPAGVNIDL
jgi:hypothetical protein